SQSRWGRGCADRLDHHHVETSRWRQGMIGENLASRLAIMVPRRGTATAVLYGLSLAVRFTSAAGGEGGNQPQSPPRTHSLLSIMTGDGSRLPYQDWSRKSVEPIIFRRGWPPNSLTPGCIAP